MVQKKLFTRNKLSFAIATFVMPFLVIPAVAVEPCGDFGECKVLIEINSTDGDVGLHFLADGDGLHHLKMYAPNGEKIFAYHTFGPMREQTITETFAESAEPLCWFDPDEDEEDFQTLSDFLELWEFGEYAFGGKTQGSPWTAGATVLSNVLPAAPLDVELEIEEDDDELEEESELDYTVSWEMAEPGEGHLGRCSGVDEDGEVFDEDLYGDFMALEGTVIDVVEQPDSWEVVLEPDFNDDPDEASEEERMLAALYNNVTFSTRLAGDSEDLEIEVPDEYIEALPPNTPVKVEVGAIAGDDNATFTEVGDLCVNPDEEADSYCEEEDED